jgi:hypothetical protein
MSRPLHAIVLLLVASQAAAQRTDYRTSARKEPDPAKIHRLHKSDGSFVDVTALREGAASYFGKSEKGYVRIPQADVESIEEVTPEEAAEAVAEAAREAAAKQAIEAKRKSAQDEAEAAARLKDQRDAEARVHEERVAKAKAELAETQKKIEEERQRAELAFRTPPAEGAPAAGSEEPPSSEGATSSSTGGSFSRSSAGGSYGGSSSKYRSSARTGYRATPRTDPPAVVPNAGSVIGHTATGLPIHVGPRGGQFHYSKSGKKVYERRKR